ncbi:MULTISPECIES: MazG-like family protein [Streptomycetaceae]|uniref:MazG-like family protein n=1 Tax=Streptomycetaceae TaxID=2062 RepID=UPI001E6199F5|nr:MULTISPECIES: MazG-like family protein [Streptomycetaceae]
MEHHMRTHWDTVDRLVRWLDEECGTAPPEVARLLRVLKITEEAGEVAEAVHGVTGGNPRKGRSHTWEDVQAELCDVIVTSMVALRTITPRAAEVFEERLAYVAERSLGGQTPAGAGPVSVGSESASAIAS